jgi:RNA polymerase sigma factor (sigma-70 family)
MSNSETVHLQDDEVAVFSDFVTSSYWKLRQYALSLLSREVDTADDLVQEAYLRVLDYIRRGSHVFARLESSSKHERESIMLRYMLVVIKHVYLDSVRHSYTNLVSLDDAFGLADALEIQDLNEYANIERVVIHRESAAELATYLDKLPKRMNEVMKLKLAGLSSQEIAVRLSISPGAVRIAVLRAKRFLRKGTMKNAPLSLVRKRPGPGNSSQLAPALVKMIDRLPEPYKSVVVLRTKHHMSYREIAHMLARNIETIKSQYHRGKKKLEMLEDRGKRLNCSSQDVPEDLASQLAYIDKLSDNLREVVVLHYRQHLSYTKIAKRLGRPEGTIKGWVNRAKRKLQQYVDSQCTISTIKPSAHRRPDMPEIMRRYLEEIYPMRVRRIMELKYVHSESIYSIARRFGMSPKDVRSKIKQARKDLNKRFPGWCDAQDLETQKLKYAS